MRRLMLIIMTVLMLAIGAEARSIYTDRDLDNVFNKQASTFPIQVKKNVFVDIEYRDGNKLTTLFTITGTYQGVKVNELTQHKDVFNEYKEGLTTTLVDTVCNNTSFVFMLDADYVFHYMLSADDGGLLLDLIITKHMCRGR